MTKLFFALLFPAILAGCYQSVGRGGDAESAPDIPVDRDGTPDREVRSDPDVLNPDRDVEIQLEMDIEVIPDPPPDTMGCNPVYGGTCNLVDNCNCTGGQGCQLFLNSEVSCLVIEQCAAAGTVATGSDCTLDSDCAPGNACFTSPVWGTKCIRWCDDDTDCDLGHSCTIPVGFPGEILGEGCPDLTLTYKVCDLGCPTNDNCNPIDGSPCASPNNACHYEFNCQVLYCSAPGTHAIGGDCSDGAGCVVGSDCLTSDAGFTTWCAEFCNTSHTCPTGQTCTIFAYPGDAMLGACTPLH